MIKSFNASDDTNKMIQELKQYFGSLTDAETIRNAISYAYNSTVGKDYIKVQRERIAKIKSQTPTNETIEERGIRICQALKGDIVVSPAGQRLCEYLVYTKMTGDETEESLQKVPVVDLSDEHINNQYKD